MKYLNIILVFAFIGVLIFLALKRPGVAIAPTGKITRVVLGGTNVNVELALTREEQAQGLSYRESLAVDTGMLFVFNTTSRHPFWMKDMRFPIDMIWIDEEGAVVYIAPSVRPESYPNLFGSNIESKYVLEVVAGFADQHQVKIGDKVTFK